MNQSEVLEIGRQAMNVALQLSLPVLSLTLLAGLIVAIFQAVTQVQEMTLTYVPKILAVIVALLLFGSWMLSTIVSFTAQSFHSIERVTK
ncbi:MAG TPA: flagellar biosynthesis protein FliQ [Fimbriimonadales bacterium]|nr:flagellar biosynthesis protein FliQ [Fimbriimonadales bacterium]